MGQDIKVPIMLIPRVPLAAREVRQAPPSQRRIRVRTEDDLVAEVDIAVEIKVAAHIVRDPAPSEHEVRVIGVDIPVSVDIAQRDPPRHAVGRVPRPFGLAPTTGGGDQADHIAAPVLEVVEAFLAGPVHGR
jgi:hypothetical protein